MHLAYLSFKKYIIGFFLLILIAEMGTACRARTGTPCPSYSESDVSIQRDKDGNIITPKKKKSRKDKHGLIKKKH